MNTINYSKTQIVFKLTELGAIVSALFWLGYQAAQLKDSIDTNAKKIQILFQLTWTIRDQISYQDRFRALNPENKSLWPDVNDIHCQGSVRYK